MNKRAQPPHYRIIFNWDGDSLAYGEHPQSMKQIVDETFAPLEGTQVDAMFWSIGYLADQEVVTFLEKAKKHLCAKDSYIIIHDNVLECGEARRNEKGEEVRTAHTMESLFRQASLAIF